MNTRTRFAPSPTGYLHIGGARTALYSWLHARKHGGNFILRIEDTDLTRSTIESVNVILEGMTWLGLEYDEGPFYQTKRFDRYKEIIKQLLDNNQAYHCYCSRDELDAMRNEQMSKKEKPRYDGRCRSRTTPREGVDPVVRFKNPLDGTVVVEDLIRGNVIFNNNELDDLIIARSDGTPTYNLTVVVDDLDMKINCVIRGDDHLNNAPRQVNIMQALGIKPPTYAHIPMILGADKKKMSKRHGALSVMQYREEGFLPEALLNYLVRLGWSHGDQEVFSIDEMVEYFDIYKVNKAASVFNQEKLLWLNQHYIMNSDPAHVAHHLSWHMGNLNIDPSNGPELTDVIKVYRERAKTLVELAQSISYLYHDFDQFDAKAAKKNLKPDAVESLTYIKNAFAEMNPWAVQNIHEVIQNAAEKFDLKMGKVAQPLRVAVTGGAVSPSIDETVFLIGQERSVERIQQALELIKQQE